MALKRKNTASQRARGPGGTFLSQGESPVVAGPSREPPPAPSASPRRSSSPAPRAFSLPLSDGGSDFFPAASRASSAAPVSAPALRPSCMRCYAANVGRALDGDVAEEPCTKGRPQHLRCTLCAGKNKRCVRPASDHRSGALALALQAACDDLFVANAAGRQSADAVTTGCGDALAELQAYVFRDGEARVPGGVGGKNTSSRARGDVSSSVVAELRLLREEMAAGFAAVVAALESRN